MPYFFSCLLYNPTMSKTEIVAKTFTPIYDELEDRVRLVVNYQSFDERIDFMITRHFMIQLIPTLEEYIENYYDASSSDDEPVYASESSHTSEANLSKTNQADLQLYRSSEELLVRVNLSYIPKSQKTRLSLHSSQHVSTIQFDLSLLKAFIRTLKSSVPYIRWGLSPYF